MRGAGRNRQDHGGARGSRSGGAQGGSRGNGGAQRGGQRNDDRRRGDGRGEGRRGEDRRAGSFGRPSAKGSPRSGGFATGKTERASSRPHGANAAGGQRRGEPAARGTSAQGMSDRDLVRSYAEPLKLGRRKGEWLDVRLPETLVGAPVQKVMQQTPLAPKLANKLAQSKGIILQGSTLRLQLFPSEAIDFPADWMELNVLYEDDFTLVVNKPSGIEVHPSEHGQRRTLAHGVASYYEMTNQQVRIRHIHRIDKETTGPVLYAKNEFAHYQYDKAMREKKIERIYLALAEGVLEKDRGTINKPIGQDRHHSTKRRVSETGDPAVTHYEVVERFADHTLVRLRLETGRTHQIRVHLSAIGHPLAGDGMYGGKRGLIARQALHGEKLIWHHPWTNEPLSARAPLPDDFAEALEKLRG